MIRMLLADDHPVVRAGLRALFSSEDDILVLAEAATAERAVELCAEHEFDIVLMDLQFGSSGAEGSMQGADATRQIRAVAGAPRVLVLTNYDTDADILGAVEAGASGYLLKDAPPTELIAAVRLAAAGESAISPAIEMLMQSRADAVGSPLTLREAEVLGLVAEGQSNRDIGKALFLSEATVKSHLVHIFTKLGVSSRTAAVAAAQASGLIRSRS
ncbi:response regulator [Microterricola viridarii]|uniref:DNA-binding response regulator, NarL/FixJ family, contains REC and HTH domains n=1 Tax=Microterricola viridarii TaxID=412690 RepID=A0A1H1VTX0_9MICO|nr:response regulator transcription factor [Microterricola viridarii]SDS87499.1 DNA-binding response regulator, NarL/FixJ family, contains REC and HTH domains [Microterricola viridarii]